MNDTSLSRVEWILGGLLVVLLLIVAILAILLWIRPDTPPATSRTGFESTPVYRGQTAQTALVMAQQAATTWQADAQLIKTTATWPQGLTKEDISSGRAAWSFTFYSPSSQTIAVLSIVDNQATLVSDNKVNRALDPRADIDWRIDSPEAIHRMLSEGGDTFLQGERITTLIMTLTTDNTSGRIEWFISLFAQQTGRSFTMTLDATSGEVIQVIQGP